MKDKMRIEDLTESGIEDLISVCSSRRMVFFQPQKMKSCYTFLLRAATSKQAL